MIANKRKLFFSVLLYTQSTKRAHLPALQHSGSHLLKPAGLLLFTFLPPCPKAEVQGVEPGLLRKPGTNGPQVVLSCNIHLPLGNGMRHAVLLAALQHVCDGKPAREERGHVSMMKVLGLQRNACSLTWQVQACLARYTVYHFGQHHLQFW